MTKVTYIELADDRIAQITDWQIFGEHKVRVRIFGKVEEFSINKEELKAAIQNTQES